MKALERCARRVVHLEGLILELLAATDASEAGNVQAILEKLRRAMERV